MIKSETPIDGGYSNGTARPDRVLIMLLFALAACLPLYLLWGAIPQTESPKISVFVAIVGLFVAAISAGFAIISYRDNAAQTAHQARLQNTVTFLLETRLSEGFQQALIERRIAFPEDTEITFAAWKTAKNSTEPEMVRSADALIFLLNHYEFVAAIIQSESLDEMLLKETVRSILCNLVDDARGLIAGMQAFNPRLYQNLAWIYDRWRIEGAKDINGNPNERAIPAAPS